MKLNIPGSVACLFSILISCKLGNVLPFPLFLIHFFHTRLYSRREVKDSGFPPHDMYRARTQVASTLNLLVMPNTTRRVCLAYPPRCRGDPEMGPETGSLAPPSQWSEMGPGTLSDWCPRK